MRLSSCVIMVCAFLCSCSSSSKEDAYDVIPSKNSIMYSPSEIERMDVYGIRIGMPISNVKKNLQDRSINFSITDPNKFSPEHLADGYMQISKGNNPHLAKIPWAGVNPTYVNVMTSKGDNPYVVALYVNYNENETLLVRPSIIYKSKNRFTDNYRFYGNYTKNYPSVEDLLFPDRCNPRFYGSFDGGMAREGGIDGCDPRRFGVSKNYMYSSFREMPNGTMNTIAIINGGYYSGV